MRESKREDIRVYVQGLLKGQGVEEEEHLCTHTHEVSTGQHSSADVCWRTPCQGLDEVTVCIPTHILMCIRVRDTDSRTPTTCTFYVSPGVG